MVNTVRVTSVLTFDFFSLVPKGKKEPFSWCIVIKFIFSLWPKFNWPSQEVEMFKTELAASVSFGVR